MMPLSAPDAIQSPSLFDADALSFYLPPCQVRLIPVTIQYRVQLASQVRDMQGREDSIPREWEGGPRAAFVSSLMRNLQKLRRFSVHFCTSYEVSGDQALITSQILVFQTRGGAVIV